MRPQAKVIWALLNEPKTQNGLIMTIDEYVASVKKRVASNISREHAYRTDLEQLLRHILPDVDVTNEPVNVTDCGSPDFVITRKGLPLGYIEAKDIGKDLNS